MTSDESVRKNLSDNFLYQIHVLKVLSQSVPSAVDPRPYQINEIAEQLGSKDEREVQRCLFILEGQKLVAPHPAGDFTSKTWHITKDGMKAYRKVASQVTLQ